MLPKATTKEKKLWPHYITIPHKIMKLQKILAKIYLAMMRKKGQGMGTPSQISMVF